MIRSNLLRCAAALVVLLQIGPGPAEAQERRQGAATQPGRRRIVPVTIPEVARDRVIGFCLYTVHRGVFKLTAQLYPLQEGEAREVVLEVDRGEGWKEAGKAAVDPEGWMATFRVEGWDGGKDARYRVRHAGGSVYEGKVRRDPKEKAEIVVAALSCNSNTDRGPRADIVANILHQDPDLVFFAGDQSYDHHEHTAAWLLFGRQFGEVMRDRPTITIPDDHDVGHPNLWGAGGKKSNHPNGADGGYIKPVAYVKMVERAQTSHLPDPYDPTPVQRGIGVYYTSMNVGGIDFAIIEDRKWKSGPLGLVPQMGPRPDHINDPKYDRKSIDVAGVELLGERQLKFLREWGQAWRGAEMKCVLSQTIFAGGAHLHGPERERILADLDSNGWPQSGRNAALKEIRKAFAFMIGGDQHIATVIHHGVDEWEDAGVSFCSPSIENFYGRWWLPEEAAEAHDPRNPLEWTGRYFDGFGNRVTMHAYANPAPGNRMAAGYGVVRFRKPTREIVVECWPRDVDVSKEGAKQYVGWPRTFTQWDNYGRRPVAWLPRIEVEGKVDQVVQVVEEGSGEVVYTVRMKGKAYRPGVFKEGKYTVKVGEGEAVKVVEHVGAVGEGDGAVMKVEVR